MWCECTWRCTGCWDGGARTSTDRILQYFFKSRLWRHFNRSRSKNVILHIPILRFLGKYISADLSWATNSTAIVKKVEQRLHFLRILKQNQLLGKNCWYTSSLFQQECADVQHLFVECQRVIRTEQKIIDCPHWTPYAALVVSVEQLILKDLVGASGPLYHGKNEHFLPQSHKNWILLLWTLNSQLLLERTYLNCTNCIGPLQDKDV